MQRRTFRDSTVSAVGLGCWSFGAAYGPTTDGESLRTLHAALEIGVDFWDTANVYGNGRSESVIGRFFAETPGAREKVTLATKFAIRRQADGRRVFDNSAAHMRESLDASLKRLGVERIDLYYVHRVDMSLPVEDTMGELARHVEAGKIGGVGLSEVAPDTVRRAHAVHPVAAVQSEYSLWTRNPELGLLQACAETGALFVAFSPLGRGAFTGDLQQSETFEADDFRSLVPRFAGLNWRRNRDRLEAYFDYARRLGVKPATLSLAWILAKAPNIAPIPGTRSAQHLKDCAEAAALQLTPGQMAEIEALLPPGFAAGERYGEGQWVGVQRY